MKYSLKNLLTRVCGAYYIFKHLGSNAYLIDLAPNFSISLIFNIKDLTIYQGTCEPLIFFMKGGSTTSLVSMPKLPLVLRFEVNGVKGILEDEIVVLLLVVFNNPCCSRKVVPNLIILRFIKDLCHIAPDFVDRYLYSKSPGVSFA